MNDTTTTADAAGIEVKMPTQPAWLAQALEQSVLARELYDVQYRSDYAWQGSNEVEGPGADVERRRAAYMRYVELERRLYRAINQLRQVDPFLCREVMHTASNAAFKDYAAAKRKALQQK